MNSVSSVCKEVLKKIKPDENEDKKVKDIAHRVLDVLEDMGHETVVVGSIGKHTWLSGDHDIDIFVLFPKDVSRENLEKKGLEIGREVCKRMKAKPVMKYAEHPYTRAVVKGYGIDIVPCYKIGQGERIISAVDRSPLHLKYVLENLKPEQRDEVRLLKQFMKGADVYGSDVKHNAFSGYVCELLIIIYGTFEEVLRQILHWRYPQNIDMDPKQAKRLQGALFLRDPVDINRNTAAAISIEKLISFISVSREFLSNPDDSVFFPMLAKLSGVQFNKLKKRESYFLALKAKRPDMINDTLFPQLRKATQRLERMLMHEDFETLKTVEYADNNIIVILFEFDHEQLPAIKQMIGPSVNSKGHSEEFLTKYKNPEFGPYILDKTWCVEIKRKYRRPEELLKSFFAGDDLEQKGIAKDLIKPLKNAKILKGKSVWPLIKRNKKLSDFVRRRYFDSVRI
ncbi:MAG: CCA tRNA nucleotidyltransferase [Candidatus Aenigmarchaeota archaeon]|nr:CCA tRNA nucleotidyltransferase [Candidatus Aenigmarchaeota archaeon]